MVQYIHWVLLIGMLIIFVVSCIEIVVLTALEVRYTYQLRMYRRRLRHLAKIENKKDSDVISNG